MLPAAFGGRVAVRTDFSPLVEALPSQEYPHCCWIMRDGPIQLVVARVYYYSWYFNSRYEGDTYTQTNFFVNSDGKYCMQNNITIFFLEIYILEY